MPILRPNFTRDGIYNVTGDTGLYLQYWNHSLMKRSYRVTMLIKIRLLDYRFRECLTSTSDMLSQSIVAK